MANNVSKLKIYSYPDADRKTADDNMEVLVNPESYSQKISVKFSEKQAPGTTAKMPKFSKMEPQKLDFELLFDSTGVVNGVRDEANGVEADLSRFKKLVLEYKGDQHRPRFLSIYWGTLKFDCCLESLDITYKLFRPDGLPLRALAKAGFIGSMDDTKRVSKENASSPDLTHIRTVMEGDSLPLMSFRIYGDPKYYIEVAKANGLNGFRDLKTGSRIVFPPIRK
ncbi:MAG: LysM peptidoglycan-binding domain-containing protein [Chlorobiaceae bacterium]|nr:LysM peptidoglycan-binding domain-containing protein [Chlorobiaceae bacterium]